MQLQDQARIIEAALDTGETNVDTAALVSAHNAAYHRIKRLLAENTDPAAAPTAEAEPTKEIDIARVQPLLIELNKGLKANKMSARRRIPDLAEALDGHAAKLMEDLERAANKLDYAKALVSLNRIAQDIEVDLGDNT